MGIRISAKVQPGGAKNEVRMQPDGSLVVRLTARPVEGKANQALSEYLASRLGLRKEQVTILRGARSRTKLLEIDLPSREELARRLARG